MHTALNDCLSRKTTREKLRLEVLRVAFCADLKMCTREWCIAF